MPVMYHATSMTPEALFHGWCHVPLLIIKVIEINCVVIDTIVQISTTSKHKEGILNLSQAVMSSGVEKCWT